MRLGILSDTHGRLDAMQAAMQILRDAGAEAYIHCGDVGGDGILDCLAGEQAAVVWGNNDLDRQPFARYCADLGIACLGDGGPLDWGGKRIFVTHGDHWQLMDQAVRSGKYDYVCQGHTHQSRDERIGQTRVINPGALQRARPKTVALLDLATDQLQLFKIDA